jgi:hypothetical protein
MERQTINLFDLQIDNQSNSYLTEIARWGKFLAIMGFILCGLFVLVAIFGGAAIGTLMSTQMGTSSVMSGAFLTISYLVIALIYFFPCFYLFKFSTRMQLALRTNDQVQLNFSLKYLKSLFRYLGIFTIVILSIYALVIFFVLISVAFR